MRKILVTAALPYANGPLHLGYIVESIQADVWVRYHRLLGHNCYFVCGEDAHGTPIMLRAESLKLDPETMIAEIYQAHLNDLKGFNISFDNFYTTHSPENKALAELFYTKLKAKGDITEREIRQAYDPVKEMFLPDRFIKGNCPKCDAPDQYGDSCEVCGATYNPTDLKNPRSVVSGATPIEKESMHFFFCLDRYEAFLKEWTHNGHLQNEVTKKLNEWFDMGLKQWDISRDGPYFGFKIPGEDNKYFYVWLDAPIGYMASFQNFCQSHTLSFDEYWNENSETELYHFIGKDIVYFHALFWPALLKGAGFRTPTSIFVHGFLTVNGQKMSKSRGTYITAASYLKYLDADALRYYFAAKLNDTIEDIDFQVDDFVKRVNSDLVGKLVNIASRSAHFINTQFANRLSATCVNLPLYEHFVNKGPSIAQHFERRDYNQGIREIMGLADEANRYIDEQKPWVLAKNKGSEEMVHGIGSLGINLFRVLMTYLQPVIPAIAAKTETFLQCELSWKARKTPLVNHTIQVYEPLLQRIEAKQLESMLKEAKETSPPPPKAILKTENRTDGSSASGSTSGASDPSLDARLPLISIEDFAKVDLRIAKIVEAEAVPEAQKLLKLTLDIGTETRQVFAGIKEAYSPEELIGKHTLMIANLAPRKMRFGVSEGMVIVGVGPKGGADLWLLEPHPGAPPGTRVK